MQLVVIRKSGKDDSGHPLVKSVHTFIRENVETVHGSILGTISVHDDADKAAIEQRVHTLLHSLYANPQNVYVSLTPYTHEGKGVVHVGFENPTMERLQFQWDTQLLSMEEVFNGFVSRKDHRRGIRVLKP